MPAATNGLRRWVEPMQARDAGEEHRAATPLELFFDLCFVVAVAQAASNLHHDLAAGHVSHALVSYPMVFFAIWWAWMNFTWYASAYDVDDVPYRLATLVQIAGVLILAAGVPRLFDESEFGLAVLGYVIMRIALVTQWLRAARSDPERRQTDLRYAVGVLLCQVGWIAFLFVPAGAQAIVFLLLVVCELAVPPWAERATPTTWHPQHIAERYGLFTLIVLGESVLAATVALQAALDAGEPLGLVVGVASGALLIVFSMWWLYFAQPAEEVAARAREQFEGSSTRASFLWGYGHYFVFGSAAAVGAGISVVVDEATNRAELSRPAALLSAAIPAALFILSTWVINQRLIVRSPVKAVAYPVAAILLVVAALLGLPLVVQGLIFVALNALGVVVAHRRATLAELAPSEQEVR